MLLTNLCWARNSSIRFSSGESSLTPTECVELLASISSQCVWWGGGIMQGVDQISMFFGDVLLCTPNSLFILRPKSIMCLQLMFIFLFYPCLSSDALLYLLDICTYFWCSCFKLLSVWGCECVKLLEQIGSRPLDMPQQSEPADVFASAGLHFKLIHSGLHVVCHRTMLC